MVFAEVGKTGARNENHIDEKWGSNILLNQHICQACESNSWNNGGMVGGKCSGNCVKPRSLNNNTVSWK